jgi:hypothetical protein
MDDPTPIAAPQTWSAALTPLVSVVVGGLIAIASAISNSFVVDNLKAKSEHKQLRREKLVDRIEQIEPCFPRSARGLPAFQSDSGRTLLNDFHH